MSACEDPARGEKGGQFLTAGICNTCGSTDSSHDCVFVLLARARWLILHCAHSFSEADKQEALPLVEQIALVLGRKSEINR